jgi:hypothetical protein
LDSCGALGARVTLLQDGPHLLRNEDRDVADAIAAALRADGVDVVLDAEIEHCAKAGSDTVVSYTARRLASAVHVRAVLLVRRGSVSARIRLRCARVAQLRILRAGVANVGPGFHVEQDVRIARRAAGFGRVRIGRFARLPVR